MKNAADVRDLDFRMTAAVLYFYVCIRFLKHRIKDKKNYRDRDTR